MVVVVVAPGYSYIHTSITCIHHQALQSPEQNIPIRGGRHDRRYGGFPSIAVTGLASISVLSILGIGAVYFLRQPRWKDLFDEYILRHVRSILNAEKPSKSGQIRSR